VDLKKKDGQGGYTFVELMIAVAILALITPAITIFFSKVSQGYAADEMHTLLKKNNQDSLNRLHNRLASNKRIFQNDAVGVSFLSTVGLTGGAPSVLGGSHLPLVQAGSLSPAAGGVATLYGNCLFFTTFDIPQSVAQGSPATFRVYPAPASLLNLTDSSSNPHNLYIDLYRFYYYYLTTTNAHAVRGVPTYALTEWQSVQYADYGEMSGITDPTLQKQAVTALNSMGVTLAFDASQTVVGTAFYSVTVSGATVMPALGTPVTIQQFQWKNLTYVEGGVLTSGGFRYGIACNSYQWPDLTGVRIPQFGVTNVSYPGGFEVGLGGTPAGREVLVRSVLAAKGASPKVETNDIVISTNARDVW
jgi:prepilin-type N-terminal cleavage/methylation domain-containing protein